MSPRILAVLSVTGLGLAVIACSSSKPKDAAAPRGVPVKTAIVEPRDLDETLVLTGTLKPRAQVRVVAEVAARLLRVVRDEGSTVGNGEVLATLDPTDYRLANDRAQAALRVADANRAHAVAEKERADRLVQTGGITDKDHLSAEVGLQVAEASMSQAKAEAAIAGQQVARTEVRAPFAGRVAKRLADPGAMLAAGTPIFTLVDNSVLEFRAPVPSTDYGRISLGDGVDLSVDAVPGAAVQGKVARLTPLVDERTRSFEMVVEVPGGKDLVGGLFARAIVRLGRVSGALAVPPAALLRDGTSPDKAEVFVVVAGKAERRAVTLGIESPEAIQVVAGIAAKDVVVLDPPTSLTSGSPVEIQNGKNGAAK
jgi:RND family efflux transporter MFP subunit